MIYNTEHCIAQLVKGGVTLPKYKTYLGLLASLNRWMSQKMFPHINALEGRFLVRSIGVVHIYVGLGSCETSLFVRPVRTHFYI